MDTPRLRKGRCHDDNLWTLFVVIWFAIAFWPARVAGRRGHNFFGYFIFSLIFFPAAIIVAYMVPDRGVTGS